MKHLEDLGLGNSPPSPPPWRGTTDTEMMVLPNVYQKLPKVSLFKFKPAVRNSAAYSLAYFACCQ